MKSERIRRTQPLSAVVSESLSVGLSLLFVDVYAHTFASFWRGLLPDQWAQLPVSLGAYLGLAGALGLGLRALLSRAARWLTPYANVLTCALLLAMQLWLAGQPGSLWPPATLALSSALLTPLSPALFPLRAPELRRRGIVSAYAFAVGVAVVLLCPRATLEPEAAPLARVLSASVVAGLLASSWALVLLGRGRAFARAAWVLWGLLPAALGLWLLPAAVHTRADRPNVLIVTADTMRASSLFAYGGRAMTTAFDALSARGVLAERYYTAAPWTVPSLESLWSSRFAPGFSADAAPDQRALEMTRYSDLGEYFLPEPSLPRRLAEHGYRTAAFITNPAMAFQQWLLSEFEHERVTGVMLHERSHGWVDSTPLLQAALVGLGAPTQKRPIDLTWLAQRYARDFLRNVGNQPFLLWTHFVDPHTPYDPPARFRDGPQVFDYLRHDEHPWKVRAHAEAVRALYRGEIRYVDEGLGAILAELSALGLADNTYVVFTVDHGEEIVERGGFGHGHTLFDEQIHVPFALAGPGVKAQRLRVAMSAVDVIPTLAGLLELTPSAHWRGRDLSRWFVGEAQAVEARPVFSQATGLLPASPEPLQAVVEGDLKLIRGIDTQQVHLFDLASDPGERHDLAGQHPEDVARLRRQLDAWTAGFPATFSQFELPPPNQIQKAAMEGLRALGYAH